MLEWLEGNGFFLSRIVTVSVLVVSLDKAVVYQDFLALRIGLWELYGAAGCRASRPHTRRTTNGMAKGSLRVWLASPAAGSQRASLFFFTFILL